MHNTSSDTVDGILLVLVETKNIEGWVGGIEFFNIVDRSNLDFTKWGVFVVIRVGGGKSQFVDFWLTTGTDLVENVETAFSFQLENNTRLLQQISIDITRGEFTSQTEVNSDKFTWNSTQSKLNLSGDYKQCFCLEQNEFQQIFTRMVGKTLNS